MNPCIDSTYTFIDHVISQLKQMHDGIQQLSVYHAGGDEVAEGAWTQSPACHHLKQQLNQTGALTSADLKTYFIQRSSLFVNLLCFVDKRYIVQQVSKEVIIRYFDDVLVPVYTVGARARRLRSAAADHGDVVDRRPAFVELRAQFVSATSAHLHHQCGTTFDPGLKYVFQTEGRSTLMVQMSGSCADRNELCTNAGRPCLKNSDISMGQGF